MLGYFCVTLVSQLWQSFGCQILKQPIKTLKPVKIVESIQPEVRCCWSSWTGPECGGSNVHVRQRSSRAGLRFPSATEQLDNSILLKILPSCSASSPQGLLLCKLHSSSLAVAVATLLETNQAAALSRTSWSVCQLLWSDFPYLSLAGHVDAPVLECQLPATAAICCLHAFTWCRSYRTRACDKASFASDGTWTAWLHAIANVFDCAWLL